MNANKELWDSLQQKGVSAKLVGQILIASKKEPQRAKKYAQKTVFSIIHNDVEDANIANVLGHLDYLLTNGISENTLQNA